MIIILTLYIGMDDTDATTIEEEVVADEDDDLTLEDD